MPLSEDGAHPQPHPIQRVLPGFEDLMAEATKPESVPEDTIPKTEKPETPEKKNLILPGFEEFFQSDE